MSETTPTAVNADATAVLETLDRAKVTSWHRRLIVLIGFGSFFNFVEVALGSLLVPIIGQTWHLATWQQSALLAATFAGEAIGSLVLSPLADRFGRSRMFQVNLLMYAALSLLSAFAPNVGVLIGLRVLLGVGLGAELTLVDSYLTETMPSRRRGRLVAWSYTLGLTAIPITGLVCSTVAKSVPAFLGWRFILAGAAVGALVVWMLRRRLPESPRWLIANGRVQEAAAIVRTLPQIDTPVAVATRAEPVTELSTRQLRRRRFVVYAINLLGPIGFYGFATIAPLALISKGFSVVQSLGYTALVGIGYPLGSLLSALLAERIQRRTLLAGATILVGVFGLVFGYATNPGIIIAAGLLTSLTSVIHSNMTHIYPAELFPTARRARELGRPYAVSRIISFLVPFVTVPVLHALGAGPLYAGCAVLVFLLAAIVLTFGPKTNHVGLEHID